MTEDEMKDLVRSLSDDDLLTLRRLAMYGADQWDGRTTINGKPFACPNCGGTGLIAVEIGIDEDWIVEKMTLHGNYCHTVVKSRMLDWYGNGEQYFECATCQRQIDVKDLEAMFCVE
jgi:predicted RNA-binding Zn-ribbon protein involved in translation (DUF1610 family)